MRYTTLIDISEIPQVYSNVNAKLLYLHMVLKSGYHDADRDLLDMSIRRLADEVGLTLSATRHALSVLQAAKLVSRQGTLWFVRKWIVNETISARPLNKRQSQKVSKAVDYDAMLEQQRLQREVDERRRAQMASTGKTQYMLYYEQQLKLAEAGDERAAAIVRRNKQVYEQHRANMAKQ